MERRGGGRQPAGDSRAARLALAGPPPETVSAPPRAPSPTQPRFCARYRRLAARSPPPLPNRAPSMY